jgi:long-subunit acyl-CoA synthetase (AMP-forming)
MADLAIMMSGHIIPIYPSLNASSINQILVHSESRAIIIASWTVLNPSNRAFLTYTKLRGPLWR